jgi:hypothetical protein
LSFGAKPAGGAAAAPAMDPQDYKARLTAFYALHNPSKLPKVDAFLDKYAGKEEALFAKLAEKYEKGETAAPAVPGQPGAPPHAAAATAAAAAPFSFGAAAAPAFGGNVLAMQPGIYLNHSVANVQVASPWSRQAIRRTHPFTRKVGWGGTTLRPISWLVHS